MKHCLTIIIIIVINMVIGRACDVKEMRWFYEAQLD